MKEISVFLIDGKKNGDFLFLIGGNHMEKMIVEDSLLQRISIMIDIIITILECSYSEAYNIIIKTKTFTYNKKIMEHYRIVHKQI